jgi:chromosome segregation ATPase
MTVKDFLAKILLGSDIHEDLAESEREMRETKDKYISARNTNEALENECSLLDKSVNSLIQELNSLKDEQKSTEEYLSNFLKDVELDGAQGKLTSRLEEKKVQLLNVQSQLQSSKERYDGLIKQMEGLKDEKLSLKKEVDNLSHKVETLKLEYEKKDERNVLERKLDQRKNIRANLASLKDEWQKALDNFEEKLTLSNINKQNLLVLQREIEDYERRVKNAIEIPAE